EDEVFPDGTVLKKGTKVIYAILRRYRVDVVQGHPVAPKLALTLFMKHGLKVTLAKRDDKAKL
uniref:Uncharacterized protein n=1 Tax=Aegilops tauschii subsp. strangulata TaxID=200361 RepID=A0A452YHA2_AEGTS